MTVVATVGTTHPLAFAGLTFAMLALADDAARPVAVVAGVTAQDASNLTARIAIEPPAIRAQFDALHDAGVEAFHIGALLSADSVHAVADALAAFPGVPVVVDPVLTTTPGAVLADAPTRAALRDVLVPRATLVTPNLDEATALLGRPVTDLSSMHDAAASFLALGVRAVLIKGGHLAGDPVDVLADERGVRDLPANRIEKQLRGTGDLLAVTIATCLARGAALPEAVEHARRRVHQAIARGVPFAGTRVATFTPD
ncbi:MAG TPA: PfkB family carbohydrate kinase [Candidatus Elarobacter sp.]|jgi:hydroxymethylpyrimidine/phosphomethylpyrimidine kinase|nr:PfkB family carbohydrate kinase [Candidatus Elarobacter sp.]